jgi:hypothetical protein
MAKPLPPAPVGTEPVPKDPSKTSAYISKGTWAQMRDWLNLLQKLLKGWTNDGTTVTIPYNLDVTGTLASGAQTVTGNVTVNGTLTVNGPTHTTGNDALTYVNGSLQAITTATTTTITHWTAFYDNLGVNFNATTGIFTAPVTGYYFITAGVLFGSTAGVVGADTILTVNNNGTTIATGVGAEEATTASNHTAYVSAVVSMAAGTTLAIQVQQTSGATRSLGANATGTYVSIVRLF